MINATAAISNISVSANLVATQPVGENNLLDIYGGAAAAYSLRRLSKDATNVVRVRRSSDNTEANFTAEQILDGDLLRWVGLGASNNGFVTTYYDQSGNGNNAVQATAASQPQIVDAGNVITSNGYTVIKYDGTDDNLSTSLTATGTMLMSGSDGGDFYEVAINGSYNLLASASNTDHPLRESIRVIWSSSLTTAQKTAIENLITYTDWDFSDVTSFGSYWRARTELTDFPLIDTSSGTNYSNAWRDCTSLTSFPALDLSSGTNFSSAWQGCTSLTSFPLLDVSSGTNFTFAWVSCTSLTNFPLLDVSNGTNFYFAWYNCSSLTSFPQLDVSSGTNFGVTWRNCTSLQDFPANMFDSVTATDFTQAFTSTNLSSQSIENIVVSIDTAGQINGTLNITGGGNATTATAQTAIDSLTAKGWTVTVPDGYVSPYLIDVYQGSAAAYSLRKLSYNTTDVVRVRRSSDNAEADFNPTEITDGTLENWVNTDVVNTDYSFDDFSDSSYIDENVTVNTNATTDPDGGTNADLIIATSVDDIHQVQLDPLPTWIDNIKYRIECSFKKKDHDYAYIHLSSTPPVGGNKFYWVNLNDGTTGYGNSNGLISLTSTNQGNGWWKITLEIQATQFGNGRLRLGMSDVTPDISETFLGNDTTGTYYYGFRLTQLTADGYVTTWYDQAGSNDATQGSAANQPKIVDAGVLVEENGKPAVSFDGSGDHLVSTSAYPTQQYQSTFYVASSTGTNNRVLDTRGTGTGGALQGWQHKFSNSSDITGIDDGSGINLLINNILRTGQKLVSVFMYGGSGSSIDEYTNGSLSDSVTNVNNIDFDSGNDLYIGANVNGANAQLFGGKIQDIILYSSDQSSNRTNIETNINDYYSIYP